MGIRIFDMNKILTAENIHKTFVKSKEQKLQVLEDISLDVEENKITVIVGASGAGKSTLLHILGGLDTADKGKVIIQDTNILDLNDDKLAKFRNKNLGFVFQFHHLLPEFTAEENVAIAQMINGTDQKKALNNAKEILSSVGLSERFDHKPAELSGGEQQRVAVARALANNPDIIFADEPTGNLDSKNSEIIHELFVNLRDEMNATFLIVTHNPDLVNIGDRVLEMKDGKIFEQEASQI
jgi:lipoprotein-releasing system ATP-binding protein